MQSVFLILYTNIEKFGKNELSIEKKVWIDTEENLKDYIEKIPREDNEKYIINIYEVVRSINVQPEFHVFNQLWKTNKRQIEETCWGASLGNYP